jgi:hypothetical protein
LGFVTKTLEHVGIFGEVCVEDLDHHVAVQCGMVAKIHLSHTPAIKPLLDYDLGNGLPDPIGQRKPPDSVRSFKGYIEVVPIALYGCLSVHWLWGVRYLGSLMKKEAPG